MQVTVDMPDQVARKWGATPDAVGRHVMEDAAVEGYRAGRLTQRQVGAMLGLDYWQTEAFLNERAVPLSQITTGKAGGMTMLGRLKAA